MRISDWSSDVCSSDLEGETPESGVCREAEEEAGCKISALHPIGTFLATPGGSSESVAIYCGRVDSEGVGGIHGLDHEDEDIRVLPMGRLEALDRLAAGAIVNLPAVAALQWLALNHTELLRIWKSSTARFWEFARPRL